MQKYNLKRATIEVLEIHNPKSEKSIYSGIKQWKHAMAQLPLPLDREGETFKQCKREIRHLRSKIKNMRIQRYVFEVYVKQYKAFTTVEWEFVNKPLGPAYRKEFKTMLTKVVDEAIHNIRSGLKEANTSQHQKFGQYMCKFFGKRGKGRVFDNSGEILKLYVDKNLKSLYAEKSPTEPRKYIGIELEFCAPIKENEFAIKLFKKGIHKFAQLKKDGSLRPHEAKREVGYELAILLEESNFKKRLKQITDVLREVGAIAKDRRAGLHVHLDMRRRNKELVYSNLVACQSALLNIVDPKRHDNEFCKYVESRKFPVEFTGEREERYKTINAAAYYKYKTLEVRMHEGSVDFEQISSWVDLLVKIANYPKRLKSDVVKVSVLGKRMKLKKKLVTYLQDRSCFWRITSDVRPSGFAPVQTSAHLQHLEQQLSMIRDSGLISPAARALSFTTQAGSGILDQVAPSGWTSDENETEEE